jgi:hypothetical protein
MTIYYIIGLLFVLYGFNVLGADIAVPQDKSVYLLSKAQLKANKYPLKCYDVNADDETGKLP